MASFPFDWEGGDVGWIEGLGFKHVLAHGGTVHMQDTGSHWSPHISIYLVKFTN